VATDLNAAKTMNKEFKKVFGTMNEKVRSYGVETRRNAYRSPIVLPTENVDSLPYTRLESRNTILRILPHRTF
jgi:hypothetical protein